MRKRIVISASLVALALSLTLFAVSVFAAVGQVFGVNNRIVFVGSGENIVFDMSAVITGTTQDGSETLENQWHYDYDEGEPSDMSWNLPEPLVFNQEGVTPGEEFILYSFTVENKSTPGKTISVYINEPNVDTAFLQYEINGSASNPVVIAVNQRATVTLKIKPVSKFEGAKTCNFNVVVTEA